MTWYRRHFHKSVAAALIVLLSPWLSRADTTIDEVLDAWRVRESRIKSIQFSCRHDEVIIKETRSPFFGRGGEPPVPAADITLRRNVQYRLSGNRGFYHERGEKWNPVRGAAEYREYSMTRNEKSIRRLIQKPDDLFPTGVIEHAGPLSNFVREVPMTLTLIYRPTTHFAEMIGEESLYEVRLGVDGSEARGTTHLVFPAKSTPNTEIHVWASQQLDYLPIRWARVQSGRVVRSESITYSDHGDGMAPKSWRVERFRAGEVIGFGETTVLESGVNVQVPNDSFNVTFPRGSWVNELRGSDQKIFLVRLDGSRRYLSAGERSISDYERLVQPSPWRTATRTVLSLLCVCVAIFVILMMRRTRRLAGSWA